MDLDGRKFGRGLREFGGVVDLINNYKLLPHHEFFCKRSRPLSISQTHYLHNVVGDTEIRKGEGMELDQAFPNISYLQKQNANIHPLNLDELRNAFLMRETTPVYLSVAEKGISTAGVKSNRDFRDKERKPKKNQDDDNTKYKGGKKHKHRHKGQE